MMVEHLCQDCLYERQFRQRVVHPAAVVFPVSLPLMGSRSGGVGTNGEEGFNVGSVHHATSILICQKPRNSIAIPLNHQTGVPVLPTVPPSFTTASSALSSWPPPGGQIGRASCRERVCQYV